MALWQGLTLKGRAIAGIALAFALFAATLVVRDTIIRIKGDRRDYSIEVSGAAKRTVRASRLSWEGSVALRTQNISEGHIALEQVRERLRRFLVEQGLDERAIRLPAVEVRDDTTWDSSYNRRVLLAHVLLQRVRVEAREGEALARLVGRSTELIQTMGIGGAEYRWEAGNVRYEYENFDGLKQQTLDAAVQNARVRARAMAEAAGVRLGELRQIELADLQVRSPHSSNRYADDDESPTKDLIADVKLLYHLR